MEVQINNYPIDFSLENENTVMDVVNSLSEWVRERNLIFTEVYIDGERHLLEDVPDMGIDKVSQINSVVISKSDVVISSVDEGARYCDRVIEFIDLAVESESIDIKQMKNLSLGIEWLSEVINKVLSLLGLDIDDTRYKTRC